ncbi:hypothetical protein PLESTB_000426200 [Pleodorina starrii]|uniref:Glycerophosphocholine acyltransferase 1 n=1 Tax=Pleodorina starrii TaxID=330485 RepID=A0A9W6BFA8_9CHLO|nr:hypothetical protein PLESTB_000426200 [Pleodorina starrii]
MDLQATEEARVSDPVALPAAATCALQDQEQEQSCQKQCGEEQQHPQKQREGGEIEKEQEQEQEQQQQQQQHQQHQQQPQQQPQQQQQGGVVAEGEPPDETPPRRADGDPSTPASPFAPPSASTVAEHRDAIRRAVAAAPEPAAAADAMPGAVAAERDAAAAKDTAAAAAAVPPRRCVTCDVAALGGCGTDCDERADGFGGHAAASAGGGGGGGGLGRRRSRSISGRLGDVYNGPATAADVLRRRRGGADSAAAAAAAAGGGGGGSGPPLDGVDDGDEYDDALDLDLNLKLDLEFGLGFIDARDSFASAGGVVPGMVGESDEEAAAAAAAEAAATAVKGAVDGGKARAGAERQGAGGDGVAAAAAAAAAAEAEVEEAEERAADAVLSCLNGPAGGRSAVFAEAMMDMHGGFHDLPQQLQELKEERREALISSLKRRRFVARLMGVRLVRRVLGPRGLLLRDKMSFLLGTTMMWTCAFWLGRSPSTFYLLYGGLGAVLMAARWALYFSRKWHYYLYDFCYYANLLMVLQLWVLPRSAPLAKVTFSYNTGPLAWSILTFRNSLVFHDLDKVTSLFLHLVPALVSWSLRWHGDPQRFGPPAEATAEQRSRWHTAGFRSNVLLPMAFYVAAKIQQRGYRTLFNYVTTQKKGTFHAIARRIPPPLQPPVYLFLHLCFCATTFGLALLCWYRARARGEGEALLAAVASASIWHGGSYYFEVFARRYHEQLLPAAPPRKET